MNINSPVSTTTRTFGSKLTLYDHEIFFVLKIELYFTSINNSLQFIIITSLKKYTANVLSK